MRTVGEPGSFAMPEPAVLAEALETWGAGPESIATLAILPERASAPRARAVPAPVDAPDWTTDPRTAPIVANRDVVHVPYRASWELAEELVGYGAAVVVLAPASLREHVLHLLRTAALLDAEVGVDG